MKNFNYKTITIEEYFTFSKLISPFKKGNSSLLTVIILSLFYISSFAQNWQLERGSSGNPIAAINIYISDPDTMYAIGIHGLIRSVDHGNTWDSLGALNTDVGSLKVDPYSSKLLYASVFGHDLESNDIDISTDGGLTWKLLFIGRVSPAPVIEIDPKDNKTVYVGVGPGTIHRTTDQGQTWDTTTEPLGAYYGAELTSLAIANSNDSVIYAGYTTGIFKSTDKGNSWQTLNIGFPVHSGTFIAVNPLSPQIVYAAIFPSSNYAGGVYKSTDGGLSWQESNNGLRDQDKQIVSITINPKMPDNIFIGLYGYGTQNKLLFESTDGGNSWNDFSDGLPDSGWVRCLAIDTVYNKIYCGVTSGISVNSSGVYSRDIITDVKNKKPQVTSEFCLYQNFPNPFNPTTIIKYSIPTSSYVKVVVLDILGRQVQKLVDEEQFKGNYSIKFDGSRFSSGVYFYELIFGNLIVIKKMILLR